MHDNKLIQKFGKDTVDLALEIESKLQNYLSTRKFGTLYVEYSEFHMLAQSNIGLFTVKFPNAPSVPIGALDMSSGEYILKSTKTLKIFNLKGLDMSKLIRQAESDWATAPQSRRDPGTIIDFSLRI